MSDWVAFCGTSDLLLLREALRSVDPQARLELVGSADALRRVSTLYLRNGDDEVRIDTIDGISIKGMLGYESTVAAGTIKIGDMRPDGAYTELSSEGAYLGGGYLCLENLPTDASVCVAGQVYRDGGTLKIVT